METTQPILEVRGLSKSFGFVHAVRQVDWEIYPGQVAALVGDNGAGKSTLIKLICGALRPDTGEIWVRGAKRPIHGPLDAFHVGIAPVYQDLALLEDRSVVMNMFLGNERTRGPFKIFLDHKGMAMQAQHVLDELHVRIPNIQLPVRKLSGGQRQAIAVGRALIRGGEIFILDEPTAALGVEQTKEILNLITTLRSQGKAVIFISHHLNQVFDVADQISVMVRGALVGTRRTVETTRQEIVSLIVGMQADAHAVA